MHVCMYITVFFGLLSFQAICDITGTSKYLSPTDTHTHISGVELPGCFIWSRFIAFSHYLRVGLQLIPAEQSLMYEKQLTINTFQPQRLILPLMHLSLQAYTQIVSPLLLFCVSLSLTLSLSIPSCHHIVITVDITGGHSRLHEIIKSAPIHSTSPSRQTP